MLTVTDDSVVSLLFSCFTAQLLLIQIPLTNPAALTTCCLFLNRERKIPFSFSSGFPLSFFVDYNLKHSQLYKMRLGYTQKVSQDVLSIVMNEQSENDNKTADFPLERNSLEDKRKIIRVICSLGWSFPLPGKNNRDKNG